MSEPLWKGVFSPFVKHRDYLHGSFADHLADHGGRMRYVRYVVCDTDPVSEDYFVDGAKVYIETEVDYGEHAPPGADYYDYLIPYVTIPPETHDWEKDLIERNKAKETIDAYAKNPVEGGKRNKDDYIDEVESLPSRMARLNLPRLDTSWRRL